MQAIPHHIKTSQLNLPRRSSPNCRLKSCLKNHNINTWFQQAGEGSSSRKRGSSPATIPTSKRRKEQEEDEGKVSKASPRKGGEEMAIMATTPRPQPMRKTAILKMAEKTSLTPQPMEMCSPSPTRRLVKLFNNSL